MHKCIKIYISPLRIGLYNSQLSLYHTISNKEVRNANNFCQNGRLTRKQ